VFLLHKRLLIVYTHFVLLLIKRACSRILSIDNNKGRTVRIFPQKYTALFIGFFIVSLTDYRMLSSMCYNTGKIRVLQVARRNPVITATILMTGIYCLWKIFHKQANSVSQRGALRLTRETYGMGVPGYYLDGKGDYINIRYHGGPGIAGYGNASLIESVPFDRQAPTFLSAHARAAFYSVRDHLLMQQGKTIILPKNALGNIKISRHLINDNICTIAPYFIRISLIQSREGIEIGLYPWHSEVPFYLAAMPELKECFERFVCSGNNKFNDPWNQNPVVNERLLVPIGISPE